MTEDSLELTRRIGPNLPPKTDYQIGCIGAGFMMKVIPLVSSAEAGFDVVAIYQGAAASDPAMADTMRNVLGAREREIRKLIDALAPQLRPELTVATALDLTLALTLPEVYHLLVVERGWSPRRYEAWLGDSLVLQLLRD